MNHTIEALKVRIALLKNRDEVTNKNIIAKLERKVRALEKK